MVGGADGLVVLQAVLQAHGATSLNGPAASWVRQRREVIRWGSRQLFKRCDALSVRPGSLSFVAPLVEAGARSSSGKPSERARAAIGYVQLVYGRQLQQPADEQPADVDPLDVASMTREQRDKLKRKLLAQHPHLVDELGLDMS